jgi:hypothetical protein
MILYVGWVEDTYKRHLRSTMITEVPIVIDMDTSKLNLAGLLILVSNLGVIYVEL